jgi:hypothetical protein
MSLSLKQLESEALHLSAEQRADLAHRLFASLEEEDSFEGACEVEQAWIEEAERRYQRYLAGETQPVPAADALRETRAELSR